MKGSKQGRRDESMDGWVGDWLVGVWTDGRKEEWNEEREEGRKEERKEGWKKGRNKERREKEKKEMEKGRKERRTIL